MVHFDGFRAGFVSIRILWIGQNNNQKDDGKPEFSRTSFGIFSSKPLSHFAEKGCSKCVGMGMGWAWAGLLAKFLTPFY